MLLAQIILSAAIGSTIAMSGLRIALADITVENHAAPRLTRSSNELGAKLLAQLSGPGTAANVVVSPFSLDSALGMLTLAADGKTLSLLRSVRGAEGSLQDKLDEELRVQRAVSSASTPDLTLHVANSAWLKLKERPRPAFVYGLRGIYDAGVKNVDFAKSDTVDAINAWTNANTKGVIPRIVDNLDARTEFLLINTTYFKGKWAIPFEASATRDAAFTRFDGSKHDVPMMNASIELAYAESEHWHAIKIPYQGNRFEMMVLTAKEPTGAAKLRDEVGAVGLFKSLVLARFEPQDVELSLPRFRAEYGADITAALGRLGLGPVFGRSADYRGLTKSRLHAAEIIQRSVVEVSEEGTEAAAATAIGANRSLAAPEPVAFVADRPFYFGIVDKDTGIVLFMGLIADPAP